MKNFLSLFSLYFCFCSLTPEKNELDSSVALAFINGYVNNINRMENAVEMCAWVHSSEMCTKAFEKNLNKMVNKAKRKDPELGLGFDPILDAQDYPDKGFDLLSVDSAKSYVIVQGKNWKEFQVKIKLVYQHDKWLVDGCGVVNIPKKERLER